MDSMLGMAAQKDLEEARLRNQYELQNRQLTMQEQAQKNADKAATISGISQAAGLLGTGYLGYKSITGTNATNARLLDIMAGKGVSSTPAMSATGAGSGGLLTTSGVGSGTSLTAPGALQAPGYTAPMLQTPTTFTAGAEGAGAAATTAAPSAASSMLSAAAPAAGLFAAQYATGKMAQPWMSEHGMKNMNTGWTYGGLPGAFIGGTVDIGKKVFDKIGSFASDVFGW
jgi:hypothetical protein